MLLSPRNLVFMHSNFTFGVQEIFGEGGTRVAELQMMFKNRPEGGRKYRCSKCGEVVATSTNYHRKKCHK